MKFLKPLLGLGMAALLFTGCKKDSDSDNGLTIDDNGNVVVGADADGAMYSILSKLYDGTNGTTFDETHYAFAWYGSATSPVDAGVVKANDEELQNIGGGGFDWYMSFTFGPDIFTSGSNVTWNVAGNSTTGVSAFTHLDNMAFPTGSTFTLPASININSGYTLSHAATGDVDGIIYQAIGNNGEVTKSVVGANGSVSFSAAELNQVADGGGDPIGFMVMPVKISSASYNGKKYYFVKQYQVLRETVTQ